MSNHRPGPLMGRFENSLQNIERRFGRSRRGALIQLGSTFVVIGLVIAFLLPIFLPDNLGLGRRAGSEASLSLDSFALYGGLAISVLGGYILWQIRGLKNGDVSASSETNG